MSRKFSWIILFDRILLLGCIWYRLQHNVFSPAETHTMHFNNQKSQKRKAILTAWKERYPYNQLFSTDHPPPPSPSTSPYCLITWDDVSHNGAGYAGRKARKCGGRRIRRDMNASWHITSRKRHAIYTVPAASSGRKRWSCRWSPASLGSWLGRMETHNQ